MAGHKELDESMLMQFIRTNRIAQFELNGPLCFFKPMKVISKLIELSSDRHAKGATTNNIIHWKILQSIVLSLDFNKE